MASPITRLVSLSTDKYYHSGLPMYWYFGGIKLGVGGLVQAYKTTAQLTLQEAEIEERLITETLILTFDYPLMNKVMRVVKEQNLTITTQHLTEQCELHLAIRTTDYPRVKEIFQNIYGAKVAD